MLKSLAHGLRSKHHSPMGPAPQPRVCMVPSCPTSHAPLPTRNESLDEVSSCELYCQGKLSIVIYNSCLSLEMREPAIEMHAAAKRPRGGRLGIKGSEGHHNSVHMERR